MRWVLGIAMVAVTACRGGHPSDDECIALFTRHEREFERLRELAASDPGAGGLSEANVAGELKRAATDAERQRLNEYLTLFKALGLRDGIVRTSRHPLVIEFELSATGLATSGSYKLIYYSEVEPAPLVPALDHVGAVRESCRCNAAYRMIDGNWYLMLGF